ncbi:MAG: nucleoside recognition domain-containing protein, partial [Lentisphaeria bacterium]
VALVLPIVGCFFLVFALFEDSGYLPRMALLLDRLCKKFGLSGRAVIPLALGFGCGSMATLATRTLETARERVIATFLLALAVPCSAQLGLILGLLGDRPWALLVWAGAVVLVFMTAGRLAAALTPGEAASFHIELPPLRRPRLGNVLIKTWARLEGYFREVLPLFILASVVIWLGRLTGLFQGLVRALEPVARSLGLPDSTAVALLFGFFRRDYGAAGLYDLSRSGQLTGAQLAVGAVALTLFLPCIAQLLIMFKERGWRVGAWVGLATAAIAYGTALLLHLGLTWTGWTL